MLLPPYYVLFDVYVSGSAYKIANKRAYHHGTMLINAQLNTLGDLLRNKKVRSLFTLRPPLVAWALITSSKKDTLVTKGVDSVRSSVRNLRDFAPSLSHDDFVFAVSKEFTRVYAGHEAVSISTLISVLTGPMSSGSRHKLPRFMIVINKSTGRRYRSGERSGAKRAARTSS